VEGDGMILDIILAMAAFALGYRFGRRSAFQVALDAIREFNSPEGVRE
jgi:hypothetical protein